MKRLLFTALAPALLTGCAATSLTAEQIAEINNRQTLEIQCDGGCQVAYTDPRDTPQMPTNGYDVMNSAINATAGVITSTAPWAAIGITAAQGLSQAGDRDNSLRTDSRDQSWRQTNDATHKPTIVTQPEPMIVRPATSQNE